MTQDIQKYSFAELRISVRGLGVYFGGPHLSAACDALSVEQLKDANKSAWKQKRAAIRAANRVANVTLHGCGPYDRAFQHEMVADVVCKETWRRIANATGAAA